MTKTRQLRIRILLFTIMIFLVALSGCTPKKDIDDILQDYYTALDSNHYEGGMNRLTIQKIVDNEITFVLAYNRIDEADAQLDLFIFDKQSNIAYHTTAERLKGSCFSVNSFIFDNKRVVFGGLTNVMDKNSEEYISVNLTKIELKFSDGLTKNQNINTHNQGYLIIADTTAEIIEANVCEHEKVVSSLADVFNNVCELQAYIPK